MLKIIASLLSLSFGLSAAIVQEGAWLERDERSLRLIKDHPELTLDHMSSEGFEVYGPKGLLQWLEAAGLQPKAIEVAGEEKLKSAFSGYPSYTAISARLKMLAAKHPSIMKLFSVGKSVEGRELWMVKISDNVDTDEVEPEFKYISSMHGNEIVGRELSMLWIEDILEGYGKDATITELVNNTEIYVMPSMNPDGSEKRSRGNANWIDLNRDFPDWTRNSRSTQAPEPETQAIKNFQAKRHFSLSANFHGGAVVVNYPWDSTYERHPLDELVKEFSLVYARLNPEMTRSWRFKDGVTNGADWYRVTGGMQDWSYAFHNDLQVTIELSQTKWPRYSQIPAFYKDNKDSMSAFARLVHQGAGFKIEDYAGEGVVRVKQLRQGKTVRDLGQYGFHQGEFYKVLAPGEYRFEVETPEGKASFETQVEADKIIPNGNYVFIRLF